MGILVLLLLIVTLILFVYLIVLSARGWGALHTTMLCFLFIECWVFMFFSAGVHYRRLGWLKLASTTEKRAVEAENKTKLLTWGGATYDPTSLDAVVPAQGELRRLTADRGRVWRRLEFQGYEGGQLKLVMTAASPAGDALADPGAAAPAVAVSAESLPANMVVYGFAEELDEQQKPLPTFYLGEYSVIESAAGAVTLKPTLQLEEDQSQMLTTGTATSIALYEILPTDSHTAFAAPGSQPNTDEAFGRMDKETIEKLFAKIPEQRRENIVAQYLRDGQRGNEADPEPTRWSRVKLVKEYTKDVDSKEDAIATERGFFDTSGRSIDARLKRGEDVKLIPDANVTLLLKSEVAQQMITEGVAELIEPVFVRPLIDYEYAFNQAYLRRAEIQARINLYSRDIEQLTQANQASQEIISFRQVEKQKLESDLGNYQREVEVLNSELATWTQTLADLKSSLNGLYRQVQARGL